MADAGAGPFEDGDSPHPRPQSHSQGADYGFDEPHRENGDRDRKGEHHSLESGRDREKSREKDKDREKDRPGHRDDRDRVDRERGDRADRGDRGDRDRSERHRSHDRERNCRDYGDRDRRHRHRSRSTSLSRSPLRDHRRETSGFDMAPPGATAVPGAPIPDMKYGTSTLAGLPGQIPGMPPQMPGVLPSMFPIGGTQFGGLPGMPAQAMTQQATRHARRVYVGGLPPMAIEQMQEVAGERGGYLHGRGALDSDDLLYLKEQMEAEEDAERLRRRTEKRAFAAFKKAASLVDSASISTLPTIRVEPKPRSGIRQQVLVKSLVKVKVERPSSTLDSGKSNTSSQDSYPQSKTYSQSQDLPVTAVTTKAQGGLLGLAYESDDDSDEDTYVAKRPKD